MKLTRIYTVLLAAVLLSLFFTGCDANRKPYEDAQALFDGGNYAEAAAAFGALGEYGDSATKAEEASGLIAHTFTMRFVAGGFSLEDEAGNIHDLPILPQDMDFITIDATENSGFSAIMPILGWGSLANDSEFNSGDAWFINADCVKVERSIASTTQGIEIVYFKATFSIDGKDYIYDISDGAKIVARKTAEGGYFLLAEETADINTGEVHIE